MKRKIPLKTVYYKNPLTDDFAGTHITADKIDGAYDFLPKPPLFKVGSFSLRCIAMPIITFLLYVVYGVTIKNKKALKGLKGCYLYGNHTGAYDAFTPNVLSFPYASTKIVVSPDAVSIKGLKTIVKLLGGIPVPAGISGLREFSDSLEYCNKKGYNIAIYPEAHIWPYYTGVRPFGSASFKYPVKVNAPVVAFFTAFQKPKGLFKKFRKAKKIVYVSDIFYPDETLPPKKAQEKLRNQVYSFMKEISEKYSNYEVIRYVQENSFGEVQSEKAIA